MSNSSSEYKQSQLLILCTIWFFWGFVAASNGIFIPFCKSHFELSQFQAQLIEFAFYGAYFIGSIILWVLSQAVGFDILNKIGYKNGMIYGLLISILGALCIIPAVQSGLFGLILGAFFIVALGFSLQQVATQPYIIAMGPPESGTHRINFAASLNSLGTTLGPLVVSIILFGTVTADAAKASITSINSLYIMLAVLFAGAVALLWFSKLPRIKNEEKFERGFGALTHPQLLWAMLAIFIYVGIEVTIQSNMGELLSKKEFGGYDTAHISSFISLYWGSLMIGRMTGALSAFNLSKLMKTVLTFIVPFVGFAIVLFVNVIKGNDISDFYVYGIFVFILGLGIWFGQDKPFKTLLIFSVLGIIAMGIGLLTEGKVALYSFITGGLCCSIMWPCIFPTGIAGLGKYTNQGATFLIMMILGGAIIPPLQGYISDSVGIHISYIIPLLGFCYLAFFAIKVKGVLKAQGLDFDNMQRGNGGH